MNYSIPTDALPGTSYKIRVMAYRAKYELPLFIKGDVVILDDYDLIDDTFKWVKPIGKSKNKKRGTGRIELSLIVVAFLEAKQRVMFENSQLRTRF